VNGGKVITKSVYNKAMNVENREPHVIDIYPDRKNMSCFALYYDTGSGTEEWHIYALNVTEAIGAFFIENRDATYNKVIDHIEIA